MQDSNENKWFEASWYKELYTYKPKEKPNLQKALEYLETYSDVIEQCRLEPQRPMYIKHETRVIKKLVNQRLLTKRYLDNQTAYYETDLYVVDCLNAFKKKWESIDTQLYNAKYSNDM